MAAVSRHYILAPLRSGGRRDLIRETTMSHASVKATNFPLYLRHKDFLGELTTVDTDLDRNDATFDIVPGLADPNLISFAAVNANFPGFYLRHQDFRLKLHGQPPGPPLGGGEPSHEYKLFNSDATFIIRQGLFDPTLVSFETFTRFSDTPRFIRHRDFHFFVDPPDANLQKDFMFTWQTPFIPDPPPPVIE
jgi:hypothetical protein